MTYSSLRPSLHIYAAVLITFCCTPAFVFAQKSDAATDEEAAQRKIYEEMYEKAVKDAKVAEDHEISRQLTSITLDNKSLIWKKDNRDVHRVLMTHWGNGQFFKLGRRPLRTDRPTWVTATTDLKEFGDEYVGSEAPDDKQLNLRMKQVLGLPLKPDKDSFVEMWVDPRDIYRPSPDSQVDDTVAEITEDDKPNASLQARIDGWNYVDWYTRNKLTSFPGDPKESYPWTRLGYTYDWKKGSDEFGLSEFIIRPGAEVIIRSITPTNAYFCR